MCTFVRSFYLRLRSNQQKKNESVKLHGDYSCKTKGVAYLISCTKCRKQYIGQTCWKFCDRIKENKDRRKVMVISDVYFTIHQPHAPIHQPVHRPACPSTPTLIPSQWYNMDWHYTILLLDVFNLNLQLCCLRQTLIYFREKDLDHLFPINAFWENEFDRYKSTGHVL